MKVLLTGASGFIGGALAERLLAGGHSLRLVQRRARADPRARVESVVLDFNDATDAAAWRTALDGIDAVVNAVGIIAEGRGQSFATLHERAPKALFEAAAAAGVKRIIQVSALGADARAMTAYHRSKHAADVALRSLRVHACIVQPSLVFGLGGESARLFLRLAAAPLVPLPGAGTQRIQPIHVVDLCDAVAALLAAPRMPERLAAVGPNCITLREYLAQLRHALGCGAPRWWQVPRWIVQASATIGGYCRRLPFDRERWAMLERGNCDDPSGITALLGHAPRAPGAFLSKEEGTAWREHHRRHAGLDWLRVSVAVVWLASGAVSLGLWPVGDSLAMLARCGLTDGPARLALYGGALLDIGLGVATLVLPGRRARRHLYAMQAAVIVGYTAIITLCLPELWMHPFAPVVKNLPMLAAIALLRGSER